ncbi:protein kinase [Planctomycetota bacterium]
MNNNESISGTDPRDLDRLLALGLDNETDQIALTASFGHIMEKPGGHIGRYKLLQTVGEGGMGVVYLAQQVKPVKRNVALKVIKPGMDSKHVIARFEAEQQALAMMEHPHIASVYDAGLAPSGRPYFVMEYVKGISITEHCDKFKLTIEERLHLFLHVCEAIQHAHQKGIIHRDLKPSNILIAIHDQQIIPKVIDFGVARAINRLLTEQTLYTEQGQLIGTPEYMSPEQANMSSQNIDTRTDIYSLGVILYELLTGVLPFEPETFRTGGIDHIRKVICEAEPKTPSTRLSKTSIEDLAESARRRQTDVRTLCRKLNGDLDWITLKALEKDPIRRYSTVDAMAADIWNYLNHQPVSAAPPAFLYRIRKFARRHRQALAAAAMLTLVIIAGLIAGFMYHRTAREHAYVESIEHQRLLDDVRMLIGSKKYDQAQSKIDQLINSRYVGRKAQFANAQVYLEKGDFAAAITELEAIAVQTANQDEIAGQAHTMLANIYYEGDPCAPGQNSNYYQLWKNHREQAEQLIGNTATYCFLRARATSDIQESLTLLDQALELDRQHYDSLRERALIYRAQQDYSEMAVDAACMITVQSHNPQGYNLNAIALRELDRLDDALRNHNKAIDLDPDDLELYDERCETYLHMERYDLALQDAQKCASLRPNEPAHLYKPFSVYTAAGQYDKAAEHYARFMSSPLASRDYDPENTINNVGLWFHWFLCRQILDSLQAGRSWHGIESPPHTAPYTIVREGDATCHHWSRNARCIVYTGFEPSWSPDGTKLVYSHGLHTASDIAVLNRETGRTKLLISPGKAPHWSPDGRYIAFVKNRWLLPPSQLDHLHCLDWILEGEKPEHAEEVWVMDLVSRRIRRIDVGANPHWGLRSHRLYYCGAKDDTLYSISVQDQNDRPTPVLTNCGSPHPRISPDERYVVDSVCRELRIIDLMTKEIVATWIVPAGCQDTLMAQWSPDGNELSVGSFISDMGLWIYSLKTNTATKILRGPGSSACWSPDGRHLAACLGPPLFTIWLADLKVGRPTMESFDPVWTLPEHTSSLVDKYTREIETDPTLVYAYDRRAEGALWAGHEKATEYLHEFDRVLISYNASACANQAKRILNWPSDQCKRLLPLAQMFARKAVEKEPDNVGFLITYGEILHHVEDYANAKTVLLRAYNLSIAASDSLKTTTAKVIHLLIQLYEAWNKPEEANEWLAKLTQTEAKTE